MSHTRVWKNYRCSRLLVTMTITNVLKNITDPHCSFLVRKQSFLLVNVPGYDLPQGSRLNGPKPTPLLNPNKPCGVYWQPWVNGVFPSLQAAYKSWLCSVAITYYLNRQQVPPCRIFCEQVETRCPYFLPELEGQYAGEPSFLCTGEQSSFWYRGKSV